MKKENRKITFPYLLHTKWFLFGQNKTILDFRPTDMNLSNSNYVGIFVLYFVVIFFNGCKLKFPCRLK